MGRKEGSEKGRAELKRFKRVIGVVSGTLSGDFAVAEKLTYRCGVAEGGECCSDEVCSTCLWLLL